LDYDGQTEMTAAKLINLCDKIAKGSQVKRYLAWEDLAVASLVYSCSGAGIALAACVGDISGRRSNSILPGGLVGTISGWQFMEPVLHFTKRQAFTMETRQ
jgi:hypothetical protein